MKPWRNDANSSSSRRLLCHVLSVSCHPTLEESSFVNFVISSLGLLSLSEITDDVNLFGSRTSGPVFFSNSYSFDYCNRLHHILGTSRSLDVLAILYTSIYLSIYLLRNQKQIHPAYGYISVMMHKPWYFTIIFFVWPFIYLHCQKNNWTHEIVKSL